MAVGLIFGAVPGLGGTTALALLLPLTYGLDAISALALAGGVMGAVPMGGSITAIPLNTPGSAPNAATCLDGYPMAQRGQAGLAIGAAASANANANAVGGIFGIIKPGVRVAGLQSHCARVRATGVLPARRAWTGDGGHDAARHLAAVAAGRRPWTDDRHHRLDQVINQVRFTFGSDYCGTAFA